MTDELRDLITATATMVARKYPDTTWHRLALVGHIGVHQYHIVDGSEQR